ncbi:phage holin family protein [Lysinibacillus sp. UGB7]|uniref:phage holin family protein n=1 Tax=Lysinibacillus sp. UGB7 TaxID=3411039 RepID=UPI003B81EA0E
METIKSYLSLLIAHPIAGSLGGGAMAVLNLMYGTGITLTVFFIFAGILALDWIAGYRASKIDGSYASEYGVNGGFRTAFLILITALAYQADKALGTPFPMIYFYILGNFGLHIWKSMTANVVRAGWQIWIPVWALNFVADEIEHKIARANRRIDEKQKYLKNDDKDGDTHE